MVAAAGRPRRRSSQLLPSFLDTLLRWQEEVVAGASENEGKGMSSEAAQEQAVKKPSCDCTVRV